MKNFAGCLLSLALMLYAAKSSAQCPGTVTATGATNISCSDFQANWNAPTGTVTGYILDVSTVGDFTSHVPGYPVTIESTGTSYPVTGLSASILYYYRVMAIDTPSCPSGSGTWSGVLFVNTLAQSDTCTCTAVNDLVCATDYISNVTINTLNNTSGCSIGGYSYYPRVGSYTTILDIDSAYTLSISTGGGNSAVFAGGVWFDFNHNSSIANPAIDPGEFFSIPVIPNGSTVTAHITIPAGASPGPTTMRVRYGLGGTVTQANGCIMPNATDGETEDYNVCIYNAINITSPPQNTISCVGYIPALCVSATGSISSYQWYSSSSISNTGGTAIPGATNACYTPDTSYTNHTGTYYFYCVIGSICGTYITTPSSSAASLQINGVPTLSSITVPNPLLCVGNPLTLVGSGAVGAGTPSYVWSGPNGFTATTSPTDTVIFNPSSTAFSGTYSLTVTFPGAGCTSNLVTSPVITVNALPTVASITASPASVCAAVGTLTLCAGATTGTGGISSYNWSGPNGYTATNTSSCITLTPPSLAAAGRYVLNVTSPGLGCVSSNDTSNVVLVDTAAAAITGNNVICYNGATIFHNTTSAGTGTGWSSSNTGVATIDAGLGVVTTTGSGGGTTTITYSVTNSCGTTISTTTLTVNPLPAPITGNAPVCNGLNVCLTDATSGGAWSSSNAGVATVGTGGCVTGGAVGVTSNATITYTLPTSCFVTTIATVNPLPTAILGNKNVCVGLTTSLSDASAGGTWSSSNLSAGTIGTNGIVTGIAQGTTIITYTLPTSCQITATVTVNPLPLGITGTVVVCATQTTQLTDVTSGGTWSSSNSSIASVGTDGTVTGVANAGGTATITYTLPTGCIATITVTVNPFSLISGSHSVCLGLTTPLTDATPGGTWSSSNSNAIIDGSTGIVTGNTLGTSTITYQIAATGCTTTTTETVNPLPLGIAGNTGPICAGSISCFSDASPGGTWSSSNNAVATVGATSGCVTGSGVIVASNATITYTLPTGCITTTIVTINPIPVAITGVANACNNIGATSCLTDATPGGSWSVSNTAIGTIGSTGCVTAQSAGTMTVTYTIPNTCIATTVFTVNPLPGTILGPGAVCSGSTITLSDAGGGTWSSSDGTVTVGSSSGAVFGLAAGPATAMITYTLPTGCFTVTPVTVNPLPVAITGNFAVCAGSTTTLSDADGTGTWSSTNPGNGSIGSSTGIVAGIVAGNTTISYTIPTGCAATQLVTVNPLPSPISGNLALCLGLTTGLTDAGGGTWQSSNVAVGSIGSSSGLITATGTGTANIIYTLPTSCSITATVTVNPDPSPISFVTPGAVCPGLTITLTDATSGGTWSSSNTVVGTIDGTGTVTGLSGGTATITYTLGTGCIATAVITINPVPSTISGATNICLGSTSSLSDSPGGGTWMSSNTAVGTIGSSSGFVTGITLGTTTITYTLPVTGCQTSITVTVVGSVNPISGTTTVCSGLTTSLSDVVTGGVWTSGNPAVATVVGSSGVVTGIATTLSTATITYTLGGCITSTPVTVNPLPAAITGITNVCAGLTTHLTDATAGGTWSSSDATIGSVGTSGIVAGISQGIVTITYTLNTGCINTTAVSVNPLPSAISGSSLVCSGATITFSDAGGGTWSGSNAAYGTIGSTSGILTGGGNGNLTITYTLPTGCITTTTVNVITSIPGITGIASSCPAVAIALSDAQAGGTWSSSNTFVAIVDGSGNVSDVIPGTATISYSIGGVCTVTKVVTFNTVPAITGTTNICYASPSTLHDATGGGTWSSSNTAVATISSAGVVQPITTGTSVITYVIPGYGGGCSTTTTVDIVNSLPPITGTFTVCVNATTQLSDGISGGTWSSSNTVVAAIGSSSGLVTGDNVGTTNISYKLGATGCLTTVNVTVIANPLPISGGSVLCQNTSLTLNSITLSDGTGGGTWSSPSLILTPTSGTVTTVTATGTGLSQVNYTLSTGCFVSKVITVNPTPPAISGPSGVCYLSGVIETDLSGGGVWSSSNTSVVFVSGGATFGVSVGTANITYQAPTGCSVDRTITVNPLPTGILGTTTLCAGTTSQLSDAIAGGTWSSDDATIASINTGTGLLTGVSAGTATITYTTAAGCDTVVVVTVIQSPTPILGAPAVCTGGSTILSDTTGTGTWSSSNTSVANIGSDGTVAGGSVGTAAITYTIGDGCSTSVTFSVNAFPAAITGITNVCPGLTTNLSNATTGGIWSSSNIAIATIGSGTGTVTGISPGSANVTYTSAAGCSVTTTVNVFNVVGPITATSSLVCVGLTINLADTTAGGTWSTSNAAIGTIDLSSGIVTGIGAGTATATYTAPTGCISTTLFNVINSLPSITGAAFNVCPGFTITLSDATGGGNWSSSNGNASVGSTSGIVTGNTAGTATITYALGAGCSTTATVTVNGQPIQGATTICTGANTTLSDIETGGTWSSTSTNVFVGSSSGVVTGIASGIANITYQSPTGCTITTTISVVNSLPSIITIPPACVGLTTNLFDGASGGTWTSGSTAIATVIGSTGVVTGVAAGTVNITYTIASGCNTFTTLTINPLSPVTGPVNICQGSTSALIDTTSGGIWTSSNTNITIGSSSGMVTAVTPGTATVTYSLATGCATSTTITVNPVAPITGITSICHPGTTVLSNSITGGTWSSSNPSVGTVDPITGTVVSVAVGTTAITYMLPTGCTSVTTVNVVSILPAITGNTNDCIGLPSVLADSVSGGTWSSADGSIATVDAASGAVTGIAAGTTTITYQLGAGCTITTMVSINSLPAPISGTVNVCVGLTGALTDDTTGGNWSSGSILIATVDPTGTVTGVSAGTTNITYTTPAGCIATTPVTVNPLPAMITGILNLCPDLSTTLSDASGGGTWSSSNITVGTIDPASGTVATFTTGTSVITYTLPTTCIITATLNVINTVAPIAGNLSVCTNSSTSLTDIYTGGTWAASNTNVSVDSVSGIVTGSDTGTTSITYTLGSGCNVTATVTINPAPAAIFGNLQVCLNATTTINDTTAGGTWSAANANITIGSATGSVHGNSVGIDTVTYTIPTGCKTTSTFTVNALPSQYHVGGGGGYCFSQPGVHILLNASDTGVSYLLYYGTASTGIDSPGTGSLLDFGLVTGAGTYTVMATNNTTHCSIGMLDSAVVTITPAVVPAVTISSVLGDTVCVGTFTTFTASIVNGGTTPTYEWFVNGISPGADSNHYSYIPANGDVVTVKLTSNAICALPDTAMDTVIMTVNNKQLPAVSISIIPAGPLCAGTLSYFTANDTFGGPSPMFTWFKNSVMVGSGSTYSFIPYLPDNGDIIYCKMVSSYACVTTDTVASSYIHIIVDSAHIPVITLDAYPGTHIIQGQSDTIVATVADGGISPRYQWLLNGMLVPGATTNTFISDTLVNNDSVTCVVYGSGECALYSVNSAIITVTPTGVQQVTAGGSDIRLVPNPNNGTFTIRGATGTMLDEEVTIEITDMLGQVIYKNKVMALNGKINEQIRLNTTLPNGMYSLNLHTEHEHKVFHLVIEQ